MNEYNEYRVEQTILLELNEYLSDTNSTTRIVKDMLQLYDFSHHYSRGSIFRVIGGKYIKQV